MLNPISLATSIFTINFNNEDYDLAEYRACMNLTEMLDQQRWSRDKSSIEMLIKYRGKTMFETFGKLMAERKTNESHSDNHYRYNYATRLL